MFKSIRQGLFAALAGFTVLICLCYTALALVISYVTEDMLIDRLLLCEAAAITTFYRLHGDIKTPADVLLSVHHDSATLPPIVRERLAAGHTRAEIATDTGQHYHLRTLDLASGGKRQRIYLLAEVGPLLVVSSLFQEVGGILTAVACGLIALALLLAWLLSRRLVSPLQVLAQEVRQLSPDGPIRFSAMQRRDEIGYLADRLASTFAELQAALQREHAFTRDISHELRTPLTVMNNALGQATARTLDSQDVAQLQSSLGEIGATIDVLFALARAEHIARAAFDLRGCIEESLLRLLEQDALASEQLTLDLPDRISVLGNRHLTGLLINNCLANALFHGASGTRLQLSFVDGVLTIANTLDPARPSSMQGFRHGQHLLLRIANVMRWEIAFHAAPAGYRVDITPMRAD